MENYLEFAYQKPLTNLPTIDDVKEFRVKGPWVTKSNAELIVLFTLPYTFISEYFKYDENELKHVSEDIRGLRSYSVRGLKIGSKGGMEFHRIRKEFIFGLEGVLDIEIEDVYRNKRYCRIDSKSGVYIPPFLLHTYETVKNDSGLLVIANTLFNPEDQRTHDTYPKEIFTKLQEQYHK